MAATIFVVRYRLQHIQPLKYDKIVQPEMAKGMENRLQENHRMIIHSNKN